MYSFSIRGVILSLNIDIVNFKPRNAISVVLTELHFSSTAILPQNLQRDTLNSKTESSLEIQLFK